MNRAEQFGQIRSYVQTPSRPHWRRLCGMLDRLEDDWKTPYMQDVVLPYVRESLSRWPDEMTRFAAHIWVHRAMQGVDVQQLEFATDIEFIGHRTSEEGLSKLLASTRLTNLRVLDLRKAEACDVSTINTLTRVDGLPKLERIIVRRSLFRRIGQTKRMADGRRINVVT